MRPSHGSRRSRSTAIRSTVWSGPCSFSTSCARPAGASEQPLFLEFAQRLLVTHPADVANAYAPLLEYIVAMTEEASAAGLLRAGRPRRQAAIVLQAATTTAGRSAGGRQPITAAEMWEFCLHAIAPDDVVERRTATAKS